MLGRIGVGEISTFWGADASPQHGQDWLLAAYSWARNEDLPPIRNAALKLRTMSAHQLQDRKGHAQVLWKLRMHRLPAMALGDTSLAKKVEVLLHGCHLETEAGDLEGLLNSAASGTFDMGTEIGITDFMTVDGAAGVLGAEYVAMGDDDLEPDRPPLQVQAAEDHAPGIRSPYLFTHSVTIPGMLHILHNAEMDLHQAMPFWAEFHLQVRQVLKLFSHAGHHRSFIAKCCCEGGRWAHLKPQLDVMIPKVLESRWSTLIKALKALLPLEIPLKLVWVPDQWQRSRERADVEADGDGDGGEDALDVGIVTSCIRSPNAKTLNAINTKRSTRNIATLLCSLCTLQIKKY